MARKKENFKIETEYFTATVKGAESLQRLSSMAMEMAVRFAEKAREEENEERRNSLERISDHYDDLWIACYDELDSVGYYDDVKDLI